MNQEVSRRQLLKTTGLAGAAAAVLPLSSAIAADCALTPAQTLGPFYPVHQQPDTDVDLTRVRGRAGIAAGQIILISGQVTETSCGSPIPNVLVEIWQACATGKYNHPDDPNTAALDTNFQYWGRTQTDAEGRYSFKTIKPGAYPATETWMRPPHIHFKVVAPGRPTLVTQMYFAGDPYNESDEILQAVPVVQRDMVIAEFVEPGDLLVGAFNIALKRRLGVREGTPELE